MLAKAQSLLDNEEYLKLAEEHAQRVGPFAAEIVPESRAAWHILITLPNMEGTAAGHLIARRFGVYHPQYPHVCVIRGRKREFRRSLFPGYLFAFVWDIERHLRRIESCVGVARVMCHDDRPVVVSDAIMGVVQAVENKKNPLRCVVDNVARYRKRRKKRYRKGPEEAAPEQENEIVKVSSFDAWHSISDLADEERIDILHHALGLAS